MRLAVVHVIPCLASFTLVACGSGFPRGSSDHSRTSTSERTPSLNSVEPAKVPRKREEHPVNIRPLTPDTLSTVSSAEDADSINPFSITDADESPRDDVHPASVAAVPRRNRIKSAIDFVMRPFRRRDDTIAETIPPEPAMSSRIQLAMTNQEIINAAESGFGKHYVTNVMSIFGPTIADSILPLLAINGDKTPDDNTLVGAFRVLLTTHLTFVCVGFLREVLHVGKKLREKICIGTDTGPGSLLATYVYDSFNGVRPLNFLAARLFAIEEGLVQLDVIEDEPAEPSWGLFRDSNGVELVNVLHATGVSTDNLLDVCMSMLLGARVEVASAEVVCGSPKRSIFKYMQSVILGGVRFELTKLEELIAKKKEIIRIEKVSVKNHLRDENRADLIPLIGLWPAVVVTRPIDVVRKAAGKNSEFMQTLEGIDQTIVQEWTQHAGEGREGLVHSMRRVVADIVKRGKSGRVSDWIPTGFTGPSPDKRLGI